MTLKGKFLPIVGQPDPARPKDVHLVGRYAIGVTWADDHGSIYPFDRLRLDDPAKDGHAEDVLTQEMTWPKEITKGPDALRIVWLDGRESLYPYPALRGLCRCAGCTGGH
ncbi:MAG TPA: gamma-butyrobetaine hydroxylase-like domain-containing protein [Methylomirabilota bacterium]|nr:gamma-butyrobetaine hydroxylase-like domain-containing protein [Methylomirabilota bacterium]